MTHDYYLLLGIDRDAGMTQIKRAHRRLSLRFHPDVAGDDEADHFALIQQAYDTLAHPARKADYDRRLSLADEVRQRPLHRADPLARLPLDLLADFGTVRPGTDEVLAHVLANFTGRGPKSHPTRELNVDVLLTADQAGTGATVSVAVPVARVCTTCGGTGRTGFFACDPCAGHGTVWQKATVDVTIPRHANDGAVVETPLHHLGIRNMWLKTHVRVAATSAPPPARS